ncbi:MAG TPA: hypothetical protein VMM12_02880 [Longimicrobiales bacterium]|nr:hypothetical protein [Longimicrobiales bacterium]
MRRRPPFPLRLRHLLLVDYQPLEGGWIAPLVVFRLDGREFMREEYYDIVADTTLPDGVFDPGRWTGGWR